MPMHYLNLLTDEDLPQNVYVGGEDGRERCLRIHVDCWDVVNFHSVGEVAYPDSFVSVACCTNDYFVSALYQTLSDIINVHFYTAEVRYKKV